MPHVSTLYNYTSFESISSFDGENYVRVEDSKYSHYQTLGLGNYRGKAFTTGCHSRGCTTRDVQRGCTTRCTSNVATELLDMTTMKWSDGPDYPFASST